MQQEPRATWALAALRQMPVPADNQMFSDLLAQIDRAERNAQHNQPQPGCAAAAPPARREPHIAAPVRTSERQPPRMLHAGREAPTRPLPLVHAMCEAPIRRLLSRAMRLTRTLHSTQHTPARKLSA